VTNQSDKRDRNANEPGSRQDRLKSALRENLKRRKSQAKARGEAAGAPLNDDEACPHGELGKRDE